MLSGQTKAVIERLRRAGRVQSVPVLSAAIDAATAAMSPERSLEVIGPIPMPLEVAGRSVSARWYVAAPSDSAPPAADLGEHVSVLAFGDLAASSELPLVRIHSTCFTGDVLGSRRCDCGPQLGAALEQMSASEAGGIVVYMAGHEGRGIGLWFKAAAYLLQDDGLDTYEANRALGFQDDLRDFRDAATLIHHLLGRRAFRLLTNNPEKVDQMRELGLRGVVQQDHVAGVSEQNLRYLNAKREHGHCIPAALLERRDVEAELLATVHAEPA